MLDLPADWYKVLESTFALHAPDFDVLAYGSRVNGMAHAGSDLDLVIRHPKAPQSICQNLLKIQACLQESDIPILIDVQDWARLSEAFRQEIQDRNIL